jgi:hypothetical protein
MTFLLLSQTKLQSWAIGHMQDLRMGLAVSKGISKPCGACGGGEECEEHHKLTSVVWNGVQTSTSFYEFNSTVKVYPREIQIFNN